MRVFEDLYELYGQLSREGGRFELVVGDGILSWTYEHGSIYHPLILIPVQLEFDADVPEFRIIDIGATPELYTAALRDTNVDPQQLGRIRQELESGGFHPLGSGDASGFLRRLVQALSPHGQFVESGLPPKKTEQPVIGRYPVLFLRQRNQGFANAIDVILKNLPEREDIPPFLSRIVGVEPPDSDNASNDTAVETLPGIEPEEILFSKQWNNEQMQIVDRLQRHGGVIVQGPPGTGKTHTIANLIGHLLAQGKTVLVTAHTSKALRVLRDQIADQLRPLCVSVLDDDLESRKQLEEAVHHIAIRVTQSDADSLEKRAEGLAFQRKRLIQEIRELKQKLMEAVGSEYREIVVAGKSFDPSKAAQFVAEGVSCHDWIPGPVELGAPLPLSEEELTKLYRSNGYLTTEEESEMDTVLRIPEDLPEPEDFERMVSLLGCPVEKNSAELWDSNSKIERSIEELERLTQEAEVLGKKLLEAELWELAIAEAGMKGEKHKEPWQKLLELTDQIDDYLADCQDLLMLHRPQLAREEDILYEEQETLCQRVASELERRGGKVNKLSLILNPTLRRFTQNARVASGQPQLPEHFKALAAAARLAQLRKELWQRWNYLIEERGGPSLGVLEGEPERVASRYGHRIKYWLGFWKDLFLPLKEKIEDEGFKWDIFRQLQNPDFSEGGELRVLGDALLEQLPEILKSRVLTLRQSKAIDEITELEKKLLEVSKGAKESGIIEKLSVAVRKLDVEAYRELIKRIADLKKKQGDFRDRQQLLACLECVAPGWAEAIRSRKGVHGKEDIPGDPYVAWQWRQLNDELTRRASTSIPELQEELEKKTTVLRQVTTELIEQRAWAEQCRRTNLHQRLALVGWLNVMKRLGKGTGKRAPQLRVEASRRLRDAREAVPVWIMPIARAVEQFDPSSTRFDVVIVDEASQCDILGLAVLYLGKSTIVVGDHEQVSPEGVGQELERITSLISEYLSDIPNAALYDGRRSVYDIAREAFGGVIMLVEHFRCVPEIIQFSNSLCYNGRIRPLRESSNVALKPHVVPYRVREAYAEKKINKKEALELASLLLAAVQHPAYKGKTFGVVSLVGEDQARLIDSFLRTYLSEREYKERRILCGTAAQFQGDERDVMFLSLVDAPAGGPLPMREDDRFRQRFNVAASRARDQMWVVYSLDLHVDLKPGDLRRRLIEYALDPNAQNRALASEISRTQSPFEREVLQRLVRSGYRVRAQWPVGYYFIDLVVESTGGRIAIECDGDRWHPVEKLEEDLARQAVLERLGWKFIRIRGSEFYRDKDGTMERVFKQLRSYGTEPEGQVCEASSSNNRSELVDEIISKATLISSEWETDQVRKCV
ncbi:AAA domain-containing protein [Syntrophothermus lipocalidus]|nr:AAA domain-containing protein [Syntrophothermus lipocalidus]